MTTFSTHRSGATIRVELYSQRRVIAVYRAGEHVACVAIERYRRVQDYRDILERECGSGFVAWLDAELVRRGVMEEMPEERAANAARLVRLLERRSQ